MEEDFKKKLKKFHEKERACLDDLLKSGGKRPLMKTSKKLCGCYEAISPAEAIKLRDLRMCNYVGKEVKDYEVDGKRVYSFECNYKSHFTRALLKKYREKYGKE